MVLAVLTGLPGAGKSTLAVRVGAALPGALFAVETINHTLHSYEVTEHRPGYAAYGVVAALAGVQLGLGQNAVVDAINPIQAARDIWIDLARRATVQLRVIEVICSDASEHRQRVERRLAAGGPTWAEAEEVKAIYEPYQGHHLEVDTSQPGDPLDRVLAYIRGAL